MLHYVRERAQGWLAWAIVIMIIIPFALWGVHQYLGDSGDDSVATVNGVKISQRTLQRTYLQQRQRLQQMFGDSFRPDMFPEKQMKQQVLQGLIDRQLLLGAAVESNMTIGNAQLAASIRSISAFHDASGKFSQASYERLLRNQGMSVGGFEADFRRDLLTQQLEGGISGSDFVTDFEWQIYRRLAEQTRNVGYMILPLKKYADAVQVSDGEIKKYYDAHPDAFRTPEEVRLAYLDLSVDKMAANEQVSEKDIQKYYESNLDSFRVPEQRKVRHILISVPQKADAKTDTQAKQKAEKVLAELKQGASFAKLAEKYSDDPGSAKKGGELGFIDRGMMVKPFDEAVFSLKKGQISGLVKTRFGYHIIQVEDIRGGDVKPLDKVRAQVVKAIQHDRAEPKYENAIEQLSNLTFQNPDTLDIAAKQLGLSVEHTDYFSREHGTGIASNPKVLKAAFSDDVLHQGYNSEAIDLGNGRTVVVRVDGHRDASIQPLAQVKEKVIELLKQEKAQSLASEAAQKIVERLQSGEAPDRVAKDAGVNWQVDKALSRHSSTLDPAVVNEAFTLAHPVAADKPTLAHVATANGGQAVVAVYGVTDGVAKPKANDATAKGERGRLRQADSKAEYDAFLKGLRDRAEVKINDKAL